MGMKKAVSLRSVLLVAIALYAFSVWLHYPYGGGHVYSDIVSVLQSRECGSICTAPIPIPYVQSFIEYPVGTAFFVYLMGILGGLLPGDLVINYYLLSCAFLLIPTLLLVRELAIIARIRGVRETRLLWFFIVTPTFIFTLLVNWYILGTFFSVLAIRVFLQGKNRASGVLMGLSAAFNLITAAPALGLLLSEKRTRNGAVFFAFTALAYVAANIPVYLLNPVNWMKFWTYQFSWYIEGSWMGLFLNNESPLRHVIPPILFISLSAVMVVLRLRYRETDPLRLASYAAFAFIFSTYVYTPQMNVLILPFFVMLSISSYTQFLAFDVLNAYVIIGFSQGLPMFLALLGINYNISPWGLASPVQLAGVIRSFWLGKFLVYDGYFKNWKEKKNMRERPSLATDRLPTERGP
jgi:hypothetical protein